MTGLSWLEEAGPFGSPIALTDTYWVGLVRDAWIEYALAEYGRAAFQLAVVAETWDG